MSSKSIRKENFFNNNWNVTFRRNLMRSAPFLIDVKMLFTSGNFAENLNQGRINWSKVKRAIPGIVSNWNLRFLCYIFAALRNLSRRQRSRSTNIFEKYCWRRALIRFPPREINFDPQFGIRQLERINEDIWKDRFHENSNFFRLTRKSEKNIITDGLFQTTVPQFV